MHNYVIYYVYYYNPLRVEKELLNLHIGRSLTDSTIPYAVLIQFDPLMISTELLKTHRGL